MPFNGYFYHQRHRKLKHTLQRLFPFSLRISLEMLCEDLLLPLFGLLCLAIRTVVLVYVRNAEKLKCVSMHEFYVISEVGLILLKKRGRLPQNFPDSLASFGPENLRELIAMDVFVILRSSSLRRDEKHQVIELLERENRFGVLFFG